MSNVATLPGSKQPKYRTFKSGDEMFHDKGLHDRFFHSVRCERCDWDLDWMARSMSLFTHEIICIPCLEREDIARAQLEQEGFTTKELDGCGYVPDSVKGIIFPKQQTKEVKEIES